jgi:hypothetical protein
MTDPRRPIATYFELGDPEIEVAWDGLQPVTFGEYLVAEGVLSRAQLYVALREQDHQPGIPLGEVIAYLGFLPYAEVDRRLTEWSAIPIVEVK